MLVVRMVVAPAVMTLLGAALALTGSPARDLLRADDAKAWLLARRRAPLIGWSAAAGARLRPRHLTQAVATAIMRGAPSV